MVLSIELRQGPLPDIAQGEGQEAGRIDVAIMGDEDDARAVTRRKGVRGRPLARFPKQ